MTFHAGEIAGLILGAIIVIVALVGAMGLLRSRTQMERDREALGDALAASEAVSAALSEEALFLSAVLSSVDSVIVLLDRGGRVRFANERFRDVFGIRETEVIGRPREQFVEIVADHFRDPALFRDVAHADDEDRTSAPRSTRHSGIPAPDEVELVLERPNQRTLLFSVTPVTQGDRRIGVLAMFRDVTAQRAAEEARERLLAELASRATTDALTGLRNRRAGAEALNAEIERARRYSRPLAVVLFDIDYFKKINDDFGHEAGDNVLRAFARVLESSARSTDIVSRWGGEEFLAILQEADLEAARTFAERVRAGLAGANPLAEILEDRPAAVRPVTVSAGITVLQPDDDADAIVRRADGALYRAKNDGRDRVEASPREETVLES
jgi:diguanylate cyclase (GGDEF)-like protein/PAS domain S-box-containing protein